VAAAARLARRGEGLLRAGMGASRAVGYSRGSPANRSLARRIFGARGPQPGLAGNLLLRSAAPTPSSLVPRVYILIDYENVCPTAESLTRIRGSQYRLRVFHGAQQTKFDSCVVKAPQPLGAQAEYIQGGRGRNSLDFHIACHLGRLIERHEKEGTTGDARYFIVSKDTGFDSLVEQLAAAGHVVARVADVEEVLSKPTPAPAPPQRERGLASPTAAKPPVSDLSQKIIDNLRTHPRNRPSSREALERHVATVLGNTPTPKQVEALIAGLQRDGILKIDGKKIAYS